MYAIFHCAPRIHVVGFLMYHYSHKIKELLWLFKYSGFREGFPMDLFSSVLENSYLAARDIVLKDFSLHSTNLNFHNNLIPPTPNSVKNKNEDVCPRETADAEKKQA